MTVILSLIDYQSIPLSEYILKMEKKKNFRNRFMCTSCIHTSTYDQLQKLDNGN